MTSFRPERDKEKFPRNLLTIWILMLQKSNPSREVKSVIAIAREKRMKEIWRKRRSRLRMRMILQKHGGGRDETRGDPMPTWFLLPEAKSAIGISKTMESIVMTTTVRHDRRLGRKDLEAAVGRKRNGKRLQILPLQTI
jgi:hypothetical protein